MERCKVICHMMISIDGKINGKWEDAPLTETVFGHYYGCIFDEFGTAMAVGSATNIETIKETGGAVDVDFSKYKDAPVEYEDFIVKDPNQHYYVSFDRKGSTVWSKSHFEHSGKRLLYLQVLTKSAKKEYLAYLRDIGIPYIFAGESATEMDLGLALEKLASEFGVKSLVVCGGAIINGAFLKDDLIDKISLVVTPYVEGDEEKKAFAEVVGDFNTTTFPLQYAKPIDGGGVHLLYSKGNLGE